MILLGAGWFFLLGAFFGSFAVAQVWRLRARQLVEDNTQGEKVNKRELARLAPLIRPVATDRSECLHCRRVLAWYDLVPVISWVTLSGRCRYCRKPIGITEVLVELGLGVVSAFSFAFWPVVLNTPVAWISFLLWLSACVLMAILLVYDARWYLLPFVVNVSLIGVAMVFAALQLWQAGWAGSSLMSVLLALALLAGLYYVFSLFGWVGLGDSILGVGLALLLGRWEYALFALFLANLIGCLALVPLALQKKLHRSLHIPFGPFLILGTVVTMLWGESLIRLFLVVMNAPSLLFML